MFTTLMIGSDAQACDTIRGTIQQYCSDIAFQGMATEPKAAWHGMHAAPDLIFWDHQGSLAQRHATLDTFPSSVINVLLLDEPLRGEAAINRATWSSVHTCLYKPLQVPELLISISNGRSMVELRRAFQAQQERLDKIIERQANPGIVGIPTDNGIEFLPACEIVRCEGLNKYTKIVTAHPCPLVSSYNIGEFAKLLQAYGFFAPHKSHLVNLRCIRRLTLENQIILHDGSQVPLSRRRRLDFISRFRAESCG